MAIASINQLIAGTSVPPASRLRRVDASDGSRSDAIESNRQSRRQEDGVVAEISARGIELSRARVGANLDGGPHEAPRADDDKQAEIRELKGRDLEVRTHEQAHQAAAGPHASGGPQYTYVQGPDGHQYVSGGEVSIDTSAVPNDPQATILKMEQVRSAALAPADPSAQDRRVAAEASQVASKARAEDREAKFEELRTTDRTSPSTGSYYGSSTRQRPSGSLLDLKA